MKLDRIKANLTRANTSRISLECIWCCHEDLPTDLIAKIVLHPNNDSELIGMIFREDGKYPEVALAVAQRADILDFYPIREVACAIRDNSFGWPLEEQKRIFEAFRSNLPDGPHTYGYWRTHDFEEICSTGDDEEDDEMDLDEEEEFTGYYGDSSEDSSFDMPPAYPEFDTSIDYVADDE